MKRILILHTGGTFGMVPMAPRQTLAPDQVARKITTHVPEIKRLADIDYKMVFNLDSADIQMHHWQKLAEIVSRKLNEYDGFVIIHGTDSMVYTAAALSFMLRNLPKPVILTGSQRPLAEIRSDARSNLINAVELATHPIPEVAIFFGTHLFRGNRAIKVSTTHFEAFQSPNFPPLAEVGLDVEIFDYHLKPAQPFQLQSEMSDALVAFTYFPGLNPELLDCLKQNPAKVVILRALGLGNVAIREKSLIPLVESLTASGKLVVVTSQSPHGRVALDRYENGLRLMEAGAVGVGDMTHEATIVKVMHLLGVFQGNVQAVREHLPNPIAGEITPSKSEEL